MATVTIVFIFALIFAPLVWLAWRYPLLLALLEILSLF